MPWFARWPCSAAPRNPGDTPAFAMTPTPFPTASSPLPRRHALAALLAATLGAPLSAPWARARVDEPAAYGRRDDVLALAAEIARRHALEPAWVEAALAQARHQPTVVQLMQPPVAGTAKNWAAYRARFIEPLRIRAGVAFWREHADWLAMAQSRFGVPPSIVVGIVGVESIYGREVGRWRVLDTLATLALDFPKTERRDRSAFFADELGRFLALCRRDGTDPTGPLGSFAGAMGWPQFMPSAIEQYAVDFDGDDRIDLHTSPADVIGSVAHYLAAFDWQPGVATHHAVAAPVEVADRAALLGPDILPSFTAAEFAARGARLDAAGQRHGGLLALVELQNGDAAPSYVAGTENFYAITRYNRSSYYAMAVIELGAAVQAVVEATA